MYYKYPPKVEEKSRLWNNIYITQHRPQEELDKLTKNAIRVSYAFDRTMANELMDENTAQFWIEFYSGQLNWEPRVKEYEAAIAEQKWQHEQWRKQLWENARKN
jgi:hypothetical protein